MVKKLASQTQRVHLVVTDALIKKIDDWRRREPDVPNFSEATRRLIEASLEKARKERA